MTSHEVYICVRIDDFMLASDYGDTHTTSLHSYFHWKGGLEMNKSAF